MRSILALLLIGFLLSAAVPTFGADFNASNLYKAQYEPKPKSRLWGALYSIGPGAVLHGAGHIYAEEYNKAALLLGVEVLSLTAMAIAWGDDDYTLKDGIHVPYFPFPIDGVIEEDNDDDLLGLIGATFFIASWFYDILGTQHAIGKYNEKIHGFRPDFSFKLRDHNGNGGLFMGLTWRF